jgi:SanA protein
MTKKTIFITFIILLTAVSTTIWFSNKLITDSAEGKLFSETATIPFNKTGLLLGTSKFLKNGSLNPYYVHRIDAATRLMKAGKIKYLIISGDHSKKDYNEPEMMREDLFLAGINPSFTYPDYAGFRTFDSVCRLKEIYGQDSVTIISQQFHNARAIYIAQKLGVSAIGFNAKDTMNPGSNTPFREKFARIKVLIDVMFGNEPEFPGNKVTIPD